MQTETDELGEIIARLEHDERGRRIRDGIVAARLAAWATRRKRRPSPNGSRGDATWASLRERKRARRRVPSPDIAAEPSGTKAAHNASS